MQKIVLTFGLIAGAVMAVMMALTFLALDKYVTFDNGAVVGYASMVLAFLMVFFGVRSYRDNVGNGRVSFGRAFSVGILITLVASCCYVATWEVIYFKFAPDHMEKFTVYALEKAKKEGATEAQLAEQRKKADEFTKMYQNPLVNAAFTILEPLPVGLLITLVTAGVLSRKKREDGDMSEVRA